MGHVSLAAITGTTKLVHSHLVKSVNLFEDRPLVYLLYGYTILQWLDRMGGCQDGSIINGREVECPMANTIIFVSV